MASELAPFLPSVAFRDQQLRSSAHVSPWPRYKAPILPLMHTHWCFKCVRIGFGSSLDVTPKSWQCVRMSPWVHTHRHLNWPPSFLRDFLVPRALFSHFRSGLILLNPETLAQTNQGIERKGK
ncbi:hypothetical protein PIB30_064947 [Stylosanthes scabra]|uniref:Uncharacterized protein n=1 Tax=Stylosanthes scabra TaxID=79078 RepID=A0ABU6ZKM5_9FABA|nr:hypothetical protein [Stylosanthes scabra]